MSSKVKMKEDESQETIIEESKQKRPRKKRSFKRTWIWIKYFTMKWRFRLDQSRAIFGLATFALILAQSYAKYLPWVSDPNNVEFWVVIVFGLILFLVFLIGGYIYDRAFQLWTETSKVSLERNPYTYVPSPKEEWHSVIIWGYVFQALNQIASKLDIELENQDEVRLFFEHYFSMNPSTPDFLGEVEKLREISKIVKKAYLESGKIASYEDILPKELLDKIAEKEDAEEVKENEK